MIQVPAETFSALVAGRRVEKRLLVRWTLRNGQSETFTSEDRIVEGGVGAVTRTILPRLGGYRVTATTVRLANDDGFFSPNRSGSWLNTQKKSDWLDSQIAIVTEVREPGGAWQEIPTYAGYVRDVQLAGAVVELTVYDKIARQMRRELPEAISFNTFQTFAEYVSEWLDTYTTLTVADRDSSSFQYCGFLAKDIAWPVQGFAEEGISLGGLLSDMARSGMAQILPREDGILELSSEWPRDWGQDHRILQQPGVLVNGENAEGLQSRYDADSKFAAISVSFQGLDTEYRNAAAETELGFAAGKAPAFTVGMPYLLGQRNASWAARYIYESQANYMDAVSWRSPDLGLLLQINDRVPVQTREDDEPILYRIMRKTSYPPISVTFEAVKESNYGTVLDATHAQVGSTAYGSTTVLAL